MIIFIETRKNNTIIKIEIKVWRRANMDEKKFAIKETVSAEEVKMLRKKLGLTQRDFAGLWVAPSRLWNVWSVKGLLRKVLWRF